MACGNKFDSARLYTDRVAGCDCHHRHFGLVAASCPGAGKAESPGDQMPEQRKTNRSRIEFVELRLSLSAFSTTLGHHSSSALHPSWQGRHLFLGGWPRLHDFVESHVRRRKRKDRLVLHDDTD